MYATADDLKARIGEVIFGELYPDPAGAAEDLADACAEIDGCLSRRCSVPVSAGSALPLLKGWALTLAEERAYSRSAGSEYAEKVKSRVAQVRKYLEMAMKGEFLIPGAEEPADVEGISLVEVDEPQFTKEKLKGF